MTKGDIWIKDSTTFLHFLEMFNKYVCNLNFSQNIIFQRRATICLKLKYQKKNESNRSRVTPQSDAYIEDEYMKEKGLGYKGTNRMPRNRI